MSRCQHVALRGCASEDHLADLCNYDSQAEEGDPHFEPVIKLTEQVEIKTNEEDEEGVFKMCVAASSC
jgi:hypothetical protein